MRNRLTGILIFRYIIHSLSTPVLSLLAETIVTNSHHIYGEINVETIATQLIYNSKSYVIPVTLYRAAANLSVELEWEREKEIPYFEIP